MPTSKNNDNKQPKKTATAAVSRSTFETKVTVMLTLNGTGAAKISTGIGFFDHMLELFAKHGLFDLEIQTKGDLRVDAHHTVEDTGLTLGEAFREALGDKISITRYGSAIIPMDDALALCAVDLSGRAYLAFDAPFPSEKIGELDSELIEEFFRAFSQAAGMNIHIRLLDGKNAHHICEAIFKAAARALDMAITRDPRRKGVPSTKGVL